MLMNEVSSLYVYEGQPVTNKAGSTIVQSVAAGHRWLQHWNLIEVLLVIESILVKISSEQLLLAQNGFRGRKPC